MSNQDVIRCMDAMEFLLRGNHVELEAEQVAIWQQTFDAALASAEKGPGWDEIVARAQALKVKVDGAVKGLRERQGEIRRELDAQTTGVRALKAYRPG